MEKKLTAQGPKDRKSYTVTIPIEWIKKNKVEKQKMVDLEVIGQAIVISPKSKNEKIISIDSDTINGSHIKILQACYRTGCSNIRIKYSNSNILSNIRSILEEKLIGYEIIEQKKNQIIIKDITNASGDDFKTVFRRIFLLIIELSNTTDKEEAESFKKSISKFSNYCQRILVTKGQEEHEKIPSYFLILDRLEKISDELIFIIENNSKINPEIISILKECYEINYNFKLNKYSNLVTSSFFKKNEIKKIVNNQEKMHEYNLYRLFNSLLGDIANLNMTSNFEEKNT